MKRLPFFNICMCQSYNCRKKKDISCVFLLPCQCKISQYIYIRTVRSQQLFSAMLNQFIGQLGRATCTVYFISVQTWLKGIECTKAKEQLRSYCSNMYTVQDIIIILPYGYSGPLGLWARRCIQIMDFLSLLLWLVSKVIQYCLFQHLELKLKNIYRIVASRSTCYSSENQIFDFLKSRILTCRIFLLGTKLFYL